MDERFEWDPQKARQNRKKHGVAFEEAGTVFDDPFRTAAIEDKASSYEDRWVTFGESARGKLLRVVYCERATKVRLISAKKATPRERQVYEESQ